ncbi:MAG TPA: DUF4296 domain-containing protein [Sphingobacteriaceae bacterium]|nr:DUF4296 domain-containing protein [Sphingobacteriaceae bacterium]
MTRLILLFFALTFFTSCDFAGAPEGILPRDKMISVLTDIQVVDAYVTSMPIDSVKKNKIDFYKSVFKKHETDSLQFRKSLEYYSRDPEKMQRMYETVQTAIDALQQRVILGEKVIKK